MATPLTLPPKTGVHLPGLVVLEDSSGYWLFEDSSEIAWSADDGTPLTLNERKTAWTLEEP